MTSNYEDILHLPHHVSAKHPQMAAIDRAAQFSPFAALTGYGDALDETARLTDARAELDEDEKLELDRRLQWAMEQKSEVHITYFVPDRQKAGGSYVTAAGVLQKINECDHTVHMTDGRDIPIDEIIQIAGDIFSFDF